MNEPVSWDDHATVLSDYKSISARCKYYREAYSELKEVNRQLTKKAAKDKQDALAKQSDEMMLLRAQLRARDEEIAVLRAELLTAKATHSAANELQERKLGRLQELNAAFVREIKRLNSQLAAESDKDEAGKQLGKLAADLEFAQWKHNTYETALKVMQERINELERKVKV